MKKIKISSLWNSTVDVENSVIVQLIKKLSKKEIEFVSIDKCDILIFGPYEQQSIISTIKRRMVNKILKKTNLENKFPNLDLFLLKRKFKPIRIFLSFENYQFPNVKADFTISSHLGIQNKNHLRFPLWKDLIDWSHEDIKRNPDAFIRRFGSYYKIDNLLKPQGSEFLNKPRKICLISSVLNEPRKSMYLKFSEKFQVDGYGPFFNEAVKDLLSNPKCKLDILKNYAFNLCPENSLFPGYYTEKIPESYLGKSLPITWVDHNVSYDFNVKSFINLLDYTHNNYSEICDLIKDDIFLQKYTYEPLLLKKPNLEEEKKFLNRIIDAV